MNRDHFVKRRQSTKPLTYLRSRFYGKRVNPIREPLKKGTGGINPCFRPSADASKADLAEYHREEMGLRRAHQRKREATVRLVPTGSIATGNRRGGPHLHQREIARRLRTPEHQET